jgi:hypothetical protein
VWTSLPFQAEFRRVLDGGEVTDRIVAHGPGGTFCGACALGGGDGHTLFLVIADTDAERLAARVPATVRVETRRVRVPATIGEISKTGSPMSL